MKLTKIFGIVLSLHVGVILLVMFQPGCQTADKKQPVENPKSTEENTSAFNEGLDEPKSPSQNEKKPLPELKDPTRPVAGELFALVFYYPFDLIKTRMQTMNDVYKYNNLLDAFLKIHEQPLKLREISKSKTF